MSAEVRALILQNNEDYTYCNLVGEYLTDDDLVELTELISQNPYITSIDLEYNPDITIEGANRLIQKLPKVSVINCDCFLSLGEMMEKYSRTVYPRRPLTLFARVNVKCATNSRSTYSENDPHPNPDKQETSICKY